MGYDPGSRRMLNGQGRVANLLGIALVRVMHRFTISAPVFRSPVDTDRDPTCNELVHIIQLG